MVRRGVCAMLAAGIVWALVVPAADAAPVQQAGAEVSLRPVDAEGSPLPGPGYFVVTAQPGETVQLYALVSNSGSAPATVTLQAVDSSSSATGGVSYNLPDRPVREVGAWVALTQSTVALEPGRAALVPFQVRVPAGVGAGERVGGLTAFVPADTPVGTAVPGGQPGQQFAVRVQTRSVAAIVVSVPGARETRLAISGVDVEPRPDASYLVVRLRNTGNVLTKAQGSVLVTRPGETAPLISGPITLDTIVPGTEVAFPIQWMRDPPPGRYQARVEVTWDGGRTTWDDAFTVTPVTPPTPRPGASPIFVATPVPRAAGESAGSREILGLPGPAILVGLLFGTAALLVAALLVIAALLRRPRAMGS
jgi:hypothetical protein